jgi:dihydrodipicolinate synthase/N-acetylneuraminate lyase
MALQARALAAALTPLRDGGDAIDPDAVPAFVDFLASGGVGGVFAMGSTGEGILLDVAERKAMAVAFREATAGRLELAVHAGAMTTRDTVAIARHAVEIGADAVAVIAPPYFAYSAEALVAFFTAAAEACAPLPFYVYEFKARSGYAIPLEVIAQLRDSAPNLAGLKVSDSPFSAVEPYVIDGLQVYIGSEPLIPDGLAAGAYGTVSGLAAVHPGVVSELVRNPSAEAAARVAELRAGLEPLVPRGKAELARRGLMRADVRGPLLPAS